MKSPVGTDIEPLYFWDGSKIIKVIEDDVRPYRNMPCLDTWGMNDRYRYGTFTLEGWKHLPFEQFPPEFKMALMLIGEK